MSFERNVRDRGVSLVEALAVGAVMLILSGLIAQSLSNLSKTHAHTKGQLRLAEVADRVLRSIERDVRYSVWMFDKTDAAGYMPRFGLTGVNPMMGSRLPELTQLGYFNPDAPTATETGNMILSGRSIDTFMADLSVAQDGSDVLRVDLLRFVLYYVKRDKDDVRDLARWGSARLARYSDIEAIEDSARRTEVLVRLHQEGVRFAWAPGEPAASGLYEIYETGWIATLPGPTKIPEDTTQRSTGFLTPRRASFALNGTFRNVQVPQLAVPSGVFPGGFEVKLDGPPTGKLLWVRMVVIGGGEGMARNQAELSRMVHCRDG